MTGNPIYLVSACATGEEFVAAFRRYADKTGLFVPIGEPFVAGKRARIAVTLADGGVMLEGDAEIVSSARTPSILHGRVGMTLRFFAPDAASKTLLGELEKARLSMKPAPPSVAPRPVNLPAEPRAVPPSPQGRIDAVNALAECVAIGDADALSALTPPAAPVPPRAGPRFVVPTVPAVRPRAPTPPVGVPGVPPGRRTGAAAVIAGPSSDTIVAVSPPTAPAHPVTLVAAAPPTAVPPNPTTLVGAAPPAAVPPNPATLGAAASPSAAPPNRATLGAAASPSAAPPSAAPPNPATLGAAASPSATPPNPATLVGAAPPAAAPARRVSNAPPASPPGALGTPTTSSRPPAASRAPTPLPFAAAPTTRAATPLPFAAAAPATPSPFAAATPSPLPATAAPPARTPTAAPAGIHAAEVQVAVSRTSTKPGAPAPAPASSSGGLAQAAASSASSDAAIVVATPAREDISSRTQVHAGAPTPTAAPPPAGSIGRGSSAALDRQRAGVELDAIADLAERTDLVVLLTDPARPAASEAGEANEAGESRPRKTALGVAVAPAEASAEIELEPEVDIERDLEVADLTAGDERVESIAAVPAPALDGMTPTDLPRPDVRPPAWRFAATTPDAPVLDERTPIDLRVGDWGLPQMTPTERQPAPPAPGPPAPVARSLVAAFTRVTPTAAPVPAAPGAPLPSGDWTIALDPGAPDGWTAPLPTVKPRVVTGAHAVVPAPPDEPASPDEPLPPAEPKVQVDPTLIEPLHGGLLDEAARFTADPRGAGGYASGPVFAQPDPAGYPTHAGYPAHAGYLPHAGYPAHAAPPGFATQRPSESFPPPYRSQFPGEAPSYAVAPGYPMMAVESSPSPGDVADGNFVAPRHSETMLHGRARNRRLLIVVLSAMLAVAIGVATVAWTSRRSAPDAPPPARSSSSTPPTTSAAPAPLPVEPDPAAPVHAAKPTTATAPSHCFADVSSVPSGAEIVADNNTVLGTTPQTVPLPCGAPIDLLIRKARLVPVTRSVTPTTGGVKIRVALTKQTALVKLSSSPAGATVTLDGRTLGITPTTIKLPVLETSTLAITKNGYEPLTEKVSPKASGATVRVQLRRPER